MVDGNCFIEVLNTKTSYAEKVYISKFYSMLLEFERNNKIQIPEEWRIKDGCGYTQLVSIEKVKYSREHVCEICTSESLVYTSIMQNVLAFSPTEVKQYGFHGEVKYKYEKKNLYELAKEDVACPLKMFDLESVQSPMNVFKSVAIDIKEKRIPDMYQIITKSGTYNCSNIYMPCE